VLHLPQFSVIPAKAGIQLDSFIAPRSKLDPGLRRDDVGIFRAAIYA